MSLRKGDIRKQEILDMAETLFCRNGYEQTGIQEILDRLKISKGSFYHHYISKESLLEAMCRKRAVQFAEETVRKIRDSKKTEDREYKSLEGIKDNYPKYVLTTDYILQNRNGIKHLNLLDFVKNGQVF